MVNKRSFTMVNPSVSLDGRERRASGATGIYKNPDLSTSTEWVPNNWGFGLRLVTRER